LIRADSWRKLRKMMDKCSMSTYMWIAMENGIQRYTLKPLKCDPDNMPAEPPSPFGTRFHTLRNILKVAFRAQSQIGWGNFLRGRLSCDWITCMDHHFEANGITLIRQECITKIIMGLWDHMDRIWTYHNNIYHKNTNQQVMIYKTQSLYSRYKEI
jgi:hypothetical protein